MNRLNYLHPYIIYSYNYFLMLLSKLTIYLFVYILKFNNCNIEIKSLTFKMTIYILSIKLCFNGYIDYL